MDEGDVRSYLAGRKLIAEDGFVDDLSENQARWIMGAADKFRTQVAKFRAQPF